MDPLARRLVPLAFLLFGCKPDVTAPANPPVVAALFDPTASPPVVPTPNDLAFRGGDGVHLNIMDLPTDSPAQRDFNAYLRTLNGFPAASTPSAAFSAPLDATSVQTPSSGSPGSVVVVDTTTGEVLDASAASATLGPDGAHVIISSTAPFTPGHRYAVLVFGDNDPAGVRGANGEIAVASPTFFLLRAPRPLIALCADPVNPACVCPAVDDPSCHSVVRGVDDDTARAAEVERQMLDPALTQLTGLLGRDRNNVILFWTFTISSMPTAELDPARGVIPFPNDLLINPATGLVNLPIAPGDPQAAVKMQLNTLDGFSTSAPETATVSLAAGDMLDPKTLVAGMTTQLINLDPTPGAEQPKFAVQAAGTTVAIQPLTPLIPDQDRYAVLLSSAIHDTAGQPLVPAPAMVLLRGANPLFDGMHSTVSVLDDMQAAQLEMLRLKLQPLIQQLGVLGVPREAIALLWTFTTQSIVRPLLAMDSFPARAAIPTGVTLTTVASDSDLSAKQAMLPFPTTHLRAMVLGTFTSETVIDNSSGRVSFTRTPTTPAPQTDLFAVQPPPGDPPVTVRFWLSIPKTTAGASGAPVVILQHGFTQWRGGMVTLADDFAQAGWAAIAFDIDLHGARTVCTADNQCNAGSCTNGVCASGLKPTPTSMNPLACSLEPLSGDPTDCLPLASGNGFIDPTNLFRTRSNGQQFVLDAAQLVRVLQASGAQSLTAQLAAQPAALQIDPTQIAYLGHSLGSIGGTLFAAVDPALHTVVLNADIGHDWDALANGGFAPIVDQYLGMVGIQRGTPEYAQLDATATWILDAVDPWSVARFVRRTPVTSYLTGVKNPSKPTLQQETGMDMVLPPPYQEDLALALFGPMGLDAMHHVQSPRNDGTFVSSYFPNAVHGTLITAQPMSDGVPMRVQAATFIASGGATLPAGSN